MRSATRENGVRGQRWKGGGSLLEEVGQERPGEEMRGGQGEMWTRGGSEQRKGHGKGFPGRGHSQCKPPRKQQCAGEGLGNCEAAPLIRPGRVSAGEGGGK